MMLDVEELKKILTEARNELVLVEGKHDREALEYFGVYDVLEISGKSVEEVVDSLVEMKVKQILILTDFDSEGKKLAGMVKKLAQANGIKVDESLRKRIGKVLGDLKRIEELKPYFKKLKEVDAHGKTFTINYKIRRRDRVFRRWHGRKT